VGLRFLRTGGLCIILGLSRVTLEAAYFLELRDSSPLRRNAVMRNKGPPVEHPHPWSQGYIWCMRVLVRVS
jgi:hypothetical protein